MAFNNDSNVPCIVGALLLIRYGNGTQAARVREVSARGGIKIDRFLPSFADKTSGHWRSAKASFNGDVLGLLPANDPRRLLRGFANGGHRQVAGDQV